MLGWTPRAIFCEGNARDWESAEDGVAFWLTATLSPLTGAAVSKLRNFKCNHCFGLVRIFSLLSWFATKCWGFHVLIDILWWIQENVTEASCPLFHFKSIQYSVFSTKINTSPMPIYFCAKKCHKKMCMCLCVHVHAIQTCVSRLKATSNGWCKTKGRKGLA